MKTLQHLVPNGDGWLLSLSQAWSPEKLVASRRPVLIVPGYGMNSFIFSYHPRGLSLEGFLADAGFEVWRVDLRAQGGSIDRGGGRNFSLEDLALVDLAAAVAAVLERTRTKATRVDVIGASLGGTLMYMEAVLHPAHRLHTLVTLGTPVRWVKVHPVIRALFVSPWLVGLVRVRGTRKAAELVLPLVARYTPWLLSVYMNPEVSDVATATEMVRTVEDPNRFINRQLAEWIRDRDLVSKGINITEALRTLDRPLLCVIANRDGIVPPETASFPFEQIGTTDKQLLIVGDAMVAMAHADLFVANQAHERVFGPIARWLAAHNEA